MPILYRAIIGVSYGMYNNTRKNMKKIVHQQFGIQVVGKNGNNNNVDVSFKFYANKTRKYRYEENEKKILKEKVFCFHDY